MTDENRRVYTIADIMETLEIGRKSATALVNRNLFRSVHIGSHIRIYKKSFDRWLRQAQS